MFHNGDKVMDMSLKTQESMHHNFQIGDKKQNITIDYKIANWTYILKIV